MTEKRSIYITDNKDLERLKPFGFFNPGEPGGGEDGSGNYHFTLDDLDAYHDYMPNTCKAILGKIQVEDDTYIETLWDLIPSYLQRQPTLPFADTVDRQDTLPFFYEAGLKSKKRKSKKRKSKKGGCAGSRGGGKKWTVKKRKMKRNANSAYFEFRSGSSRKFWRIVKNGSKITTHYGKIGTLGQMTTKDYGSKVDQKLDSLIKSKKGKGYVEKTDFGVSNPKPPTSVEREYMKTCNKAEQNKVLNPNMISYDCEGMMDQGDSELKWMTGWYKDALKKGEFDWSSYEEHSKSKRKKK